MPGPEINAGNGTTAELQKELDRLKKEAEAIDPKYEYVGSVHHGGSIPTDKYAPYLPLIEKLETYIAERGNSKLEDCSKSLVFDGKTLSEASGSPSWPADSGKPDKDGKFDYSNKRQRIPGLGGIPEGVYWIDPSELREAGFVFGRHIQAKDAWGEASITIHPFDTTHTFGRGGFFIHGGTTRGSAGCIDLTTHSGMFALWLKNVCGGKKCKMKIVVKY